MRINKYILTMLVAAFASYSVCAFALDYKDKVNFKGPVTLTGPIQGASPMNFEGATVNGTKTTIAVTDPTAARTVTVPDATGTIAVECIASHDYGDTVVDWTMTRAESQCSHIVFTNASGAVNAILDAAYPGKIRTVVNSSGQEVTLKVTGQTGSAVASGKNAVFVDNATDTVEISEQP